MWEDGVYLDVKATTGAIIVGNRGGVWLTRTVRRKPERTMGTQQSGDDRDGSWAQERG